MTEGKKKVRKIKIEKRKEGKKGRKEGVWEGGWERKIEKGFRVWKSIN